MGSDTKIEWCHRTFNPWRGCAKVHAGCTHCYAEKSLPVVMRPGGKLPWGEVWAGGERVVASEAAWKEPMRWARAAARAGERHRVFCASLADVLEVPPSPPFEMTDRRQASARANEARNVLDDARDRLWSVIRQTHRIEWDLRGEKVAEGGLDWLFLTKRPENWRLVPEDVRPLVWLGTSISDQKTANEWMTRLLQAKGFRLRFLSVEPLLGPVNLGLMGTVPASISPAYRPVASMIDWVIVGGESGPKARPCNVEWVRDVVRQCRDAGVPCFVKQLGAQPCSERLLRGATMAARREVAPLDLNDKKGGDMAEWPEGLRVRELPEGTLDA